MSKNSPHLPACHYNLNMLTIVLQAGGKSSRMGKDKGLVPFLGQPLIERLRDRFQNLNSEMFIICNDFSGYEYLGLPLHGDIIPDRGALGGLYTALKIAQTPYVGLIAVDMPFASPPLLSFLLDQIQLSGADAILPSTQNGLEPLHGVYRRSTCLTYVREVIEEDRWRMTAWHQRAKVEVLDPIKTRSIAGSENTFFNLNTPDDLAAAEKLARRDQLS